MLPYLNIGYEHRSSFRQDISNEGLKPLFFSIYESELNVMASETLNKLELETGGSIHGLKTRSEEFIIFLATPPGKAAYHSGYRFQMDLDFLKKVDRHIKDKYKLDHLGDWHSHIIDLSSPSPGDTSNTNKISRKNNYDRYIQLIITIHHYYRKKYIKFNSYIYTDAKYGSPHPCLIYVLPGISPIRVALERDGNLPELTERCTLNDNVLSILPSAQKAVSSPDTSPPPTKEILNRRIEKQLLKLPTEVLSRVEVVINKGFTIVTVPIPRSPYFLYFAYADECPAEISGVYYGQNDKNPPVEVTPHALKYGPYTHIKIIWLWFMRFLELLFNDGK